MRTRNIISGLLYLLAALLPVLAWEYYNWRFDGADPVGNEEIPVVFCCLLLMLLSGAAGVAISNDDPKSHE